jgi:chemotaxis protein MotB
MSAPILPGGKKPEKPANHERWVISYADLLTLLLATFVVLYASSTRNARKENELAAAFVIAFHGTPVSVIKDSGASRGVMKQQPSPIPRPIETPASANSRIPRNMEHQLAAEILSLAKLHEKLSALLQPLVTRHEVSIQSEPLTLTIQLDASVLFSSGEATLKPPAIVLLKQVAAGLAQMPAPFTTVVQGYTDDQPIDTAQFSSNWSLSAARAVQVVELFGRDGVNGAQLAAEGYGQFAPVAPNSTDAGRAQNRRVVVVVHAPEPAGT